MAHVHALVLGCLCASASAAPSSRDAIDLEHALSRWLLEKVDHGMHIGFGSEADVGSTSAHVRKVPRPDI